MYRQHGDNKAVADATNVDAAADDDVDDEDNDGDIDDIICIISSTSTKI